MYTIPRPPLLPPVPRQSAMPLPSEYQESPRRAIRRFAPRLVGHSSRAGYDRRDESLPFPGGSQPMLMMRPLVAVCCCLLVASPVVVAAAAPKVVEKGTFTFKPV